MSDRSSKQYSIIPEFNKVESMQFMDASFSHWRLTMRSPTWRPPTDVFETENALIVRIEIAGLHESEFSIQLDGRYLTINGTRPDVSERRAYHQMEIRFGEFSVDLEIPFNVIADSIEAVYNNGFLRVTLPKAQPTQIDIE